MAQVAPYPQPILQLLIQTRREPACVERAAKGQCLLYSHCAPASMIGALWRFRGLLAEMFDRRSAVHALKPCRLLIPKNTDIQNCM
jgi:hypothetical protein